MKVILIKDCKDGKANTVIDVSDGYGKNFLINKGFAMPFNNSTEKILNKKLDTIVQNEMEIRQEALVLKEKIENEQISFVLDASIDANRNLIVHGCVSTKEVVKKLRTLGYDLDKYAVQNVRLIEEGHHEVQVMIYKDIYAKLRLEIKYARK